MRNAEHHYTQSDNNNETFTLPMAAGELASALKSEKHIAFGDTDIRMSKSGKEKFENPLTGEVTEHDVYVVKVKHGKTEAYISLIESTDGNNTRYDMLDTAIGNHTKTDKKHGDHFAGLSRWDRSYDGVYRKLPVEYVNNLADSDLDPAEIKELVDALSITLEQASAKLERDSKHPASSAKSRALLFGMGAMAVVLTACSGMETLDIPAPQTIAASTRTPAPLATRTYTYTPTPTTTSTPTPTSTPTETSTPTATIDPTKEAERAATLRADRLQHEADMAVENAIYGTPTPPETWQALYEIAQKNTAEIFLDGGQCSGTLVNGSIVGRPDMGIIVTAKHCVYDFYNHIEFHGPLGFKIPNQADIDINIPEEDYAYSYLHAVKGELAEEDTDDIGIIVIPLIGSDTLQELFANAITSVNEEFDGTTEVVASGFPDLYRQQLTLLDPEGAKQPEVQVIKPSKYRPEQFLYYLEASQQPAGYGPGASGGGVYNDKGELCGVITKMNSDPGNEKIIGISPLIMFNDLVNDALTAYEGKKG